MPQKHVKNTVNRIFSLPPFVNFFEEADYDSCVVCAACPDGEQWRRSTSEEAPLCERSCQDIYSSPPVSCSHSSGSCVCREGLYRDAGGACVIPALCPCRDQGVLREVRTHTQRGGVIRCSPACSHCAFLILWRIWGCMSSMVFTFRPIHPHCVIYL